MLHDAGRRSAAITRAAVLGLPLIVLAAYAAGAWHKDFAGWDDWLYIRDSPQMRSADGLRRIWTTSESPQYYPLSFTLLWLEYRAFGPAPAAFYAVNVALHAAASVAAYFLLRRMLRLRADSSLAADAAALVGAAFFAVHPIQVASVAWLAETKNVLSGLLALIAATLYLRSVALGSRAAYVAALVVWAAALLAKTAVLPMALSLAALEWLAYRPPLGRALLRAAPLLALAAAAASITWIREQQTHVFAFPWPERLLAAGAALWFYVGKLVWPHPMPAIYPRWFVTAGSVLWWLPLVAALTVAALLLSRARRVGRLTLWAGLHYVLILAPVSGIFPFGYLEHAAVADHFAYLAVLSASLLIGLALRRWAGSIETHNPRRRRLLYGAAAVALLLLGIRTFEQAQVWRDGPTLWRHTLRYNPDSGVAHGNLGGVVADRGEHAAAARHLETARRLLPFNADVRSNLAAAYLALGRPDAALREGAMACQLAPRDALCHVNFGAALAACGRLPQAIDEFRAALAIDDRNDQARRRLAQALLADGAAADAERELRSVLSEAPDDHAARALLAAALARSGRPTEAIGEYERLVAGGAADADARANLGTLLVRSGQAQRALPHLLEAIRLRPEHADAHFMLALALSGMSRHAEALPHAARAAELRPEDGEARHVLAGVLLALGRRDEALAEFRRAAVFLPDSALIAAQTAWLIATRANPTPAEVDEAVRLAGRARDLTQSRDPFALDALGAALASAGRFAEAAESAAQAADIVRKSGNPALAEAIAARAAKYQRNERHVEE